MLVIFYSCFYFFFVFLRDKFEKANRDIFFIIIKVLYLTIAPPTPLPIMPSQTEIFLNISMTHEQELLHTFS